MLKKNNKISRNRKIIYTTLSLLMLFSFLFMITSIILFNFSNSQESIIMNSSGTVDNKVLNTELIVLILMIIFTCITAITIIVLLIIWILFYFREKNTIKIQLDAKEVDIPNGVKNV